MKFKIEVLSTERLKLIVEADNLDEAYSVAADTDGSEFSLIPNSSNWDIVEVYPEQELNK
jgi:hypothetical protein|tara:strand:- start:57 stop:236 length:180 start_codon:yes stop_codon:yes gene_type:complete